VRSVRGWVQGTVGGLPAAFWYLWTGTLINRLGAFVAPFLAIYLTQGRGLSASYAGLVVGLYGAGGFAQEHLGNTTLWLGCAALTALAAVGHVLSGPARERRAAQLRDAQSSTARSGVIRPRTGSAATATSSR
jgi:hypothetical protein